MIVMAVCQRKKTIFEVLFLFFLLREPQESTNEIIGSASFLR